MTIPTIKLGNFTLEPAHAPTDPRLSLLLWGPSGHGKTTLAATAPGTKLWLLFDPDGALSLANRTDILVLDLSGEKHTITEKFKSDNPLQIEELLNNRPDIQTVVFDSATAFAQLATENAVAGVKSATLENPGLKGYGHRNAVTLRAIVSLLRLTKRTRRHFIVITHEDSPSMNEQGVVMHITLALGGKIGDLVGMQINEIWHLSDTGKERRIAVRACRSRKPMKTRLFHTDKSPEFVWHFDANTLEGDTIEKWIADWTANNHQKIPLPSSS